jgi:hypothetical protein
MYNSTSLCRQTDEVTESCGQVAQEASADNNIAGH